MGNNSGVFIMVHKRTGKKIKLKFFKFPPSASAWSLANRVDRMVINRTPACPKGHVLKSGDSSN